MTFHGTRTDGWLIPGALGFLAVAVVFATVMLVWHGGIGAGAAPSGPNPPAAAPASARSAAPAASGAAPASPTAAAPSGGAGGPVVTVRGVKSGLCLDVADAQDPQGAAAIQAD